VHDEEKVVRKKKWEYEITSWLGLPTKGKWVPEPILTKTKRVFERHTHSAESTRAKPVIVKQQLEEFIHMSGGYRPSFDGEKKTRKSFFFRGARLWRT
jgi:hypothetical protein